MADPEGGLGLYYGMYYLLAKFIGQVYWCRRMIFELFILGVGSRIDELL